MSCFQRNDCARRWCEDGLINGAAFYGEKLGWRMPRSGLLLYLASRRTGKPQYSSFGLC
jgi:hypothetical protein